MENFKSDQASRIWDIETKDDSKAVNRVDGRVSVAVVVISLLNGVVWL